MVGTELPGAVRLRPLEDADLPIFEDDYSSRDGAGEYQWFGFSPPGRGRAAMGALEWREATWHDYRMYSLLRTDGTR